MRKLFKTFSFFSYESAVDNLGAHSMMIVFETQQKTFFVVKILCQKHYGEHELTSSPRHSTDITFSPTFSSMNG